jgi:hypothetical protein
MNTHAADRARCRSAKRWLQVRFGGEWIEFFRCGPRSSPPLPVASVLSASQFRCLYLFPWHRRTGSQVPYESPNESHASYTPDTAWPVGRFPPHS